MIQFVYASAASVPFTPDLLTRLLQKARVRNSLYGVTGMLLYDAGSFLQVLEGPEAGVDLIFDSIKRDARHRNARILSRQSIDRPEFNDWAMGFADTSLWPAKLPGMVDYHRVLPKLTSGSTDAKRFLRFFQEGLCR